MPFTYPYPHPAVTVDILLFALREDDLQVLLIQRRNDPFAGRWAFPGGFVEIDEDLDVAALRELQEETGVTDVTVEQLHTFGAPKRDPRERVISVVYSALIRPDQHLVRADSDAAAAGWFSVRRPPRLAFDHAAILALARSRLEAAVQHSPAIFRLLPPRFTMTALHRAYEIVLHRTLDRARFRRKILATGVVSPVERRHGSRQRPPGGGIFRFDAAGHARRQARGNGFGIDLRLDHKRANA
jgi:8-oxo-dGTP diphosphatase